MSKNILIIDDDSLIRKALGEALAAKGFGVREAENGKKGLESALSSHPDLVVSDLRMPEMDGLTMLEQLRQDAWGKTVPVIMLSTDESTSSINQALQAGVTVYLSKSGTAPDAVVQQITTALGA